jgi:amino acid transporter
MIRYVVVTRCCKAISLYYSITLTFFYFLFVIQVCCLAEEAQDAKRNLPRAILWVLAGVTALYMTATLALTGMQHYDEISPVSGFPSAFRDGGAIVASQITALGEIATLPIVILTCLMAQPRLMVGDDTAIFLTFFLTAESQFTAYISSFISMAWRWMACCHQCFNKLIPRALWSMGPLSLAP